MATRITNTMAYATDGVMVTCEDNGLPVVEGLAVKLPPRPGPGEKRMTIWNAVG